MLAPVEGLRHAVRVKRCSCGVEPGWLRPVGRRNARHHWRCLNRFAGISTRKSETAVATSRGERRGSGDAAQHERDGLDTIVAAPDALSHGGATSSRWHWPASPNRYGRWRAGDRCGQTDQPAGAQRRHRGSAGGRGRPRLCGWWRTRCASCLRLRAIPAGRSMRRVSSVTRAIHEVLSVSSATLGRPACWQSGVWPADPGRWYSACARRPEVGRCLRSLTVEGQMVARRDRRIARGALQFQDRVGQVLGHVSPTWGGSKGGTSPVLRAGPTIRHRPTNRSTSGCGWWRWPAPTPHPNNIPCIGARAAARAQDAAGITFF